MTSLIERHVTTAARERLSASPGLVIEGARQVGKSTLASMIAQPDAVLMNLDRQATLDAAAADPEGFVDQAGSRQLVIDEIQRRPELTLAIKASIDENRALGRFLLTGSASLLRIRGTADSMAGRLARLQLYGLSVGELSGQWDDIADHIRTDGVEALTAATSQLTRSDYAELVARGGYPEVQNLAERARRAWIDDYIQAIVGRDLSELRREIRPARAYALLRTLAGRQSTEIVRERLGRDSGIPPTTLTGYLDLLGDVGLTASIPPWTPNLSSREIGRHKSLVLDSGVALRLARMSAEQLGKFEYGEALGGFLEAFVTAELLKQQTWSSTDFELFHYRDRNGTEVDLVLEFDDGTVIGIEVKAASSYGRGQFTGLASLRDRLGERFLGGVVLTTAAKGYRFADRLVGAPVSTLWSSPPTTDR